MATLNKDLGPVTAYAYAKEGGYTGTATQFEKDLADSANLINTIDEMISDKADLVNGKVPSSQLPSYVDDVIEGYYKQTDGKFYEESTYETEITGETGKIYVDLATDNSYRWSGSAFAKINDVDVTAKADKVSNATNNNFAALDANGNLKDSGHKHSDYLTQHQDISGKADKVSNATNGHLAGLDANGNLTDSGIDPTDLDSGHTILDGSGSAMTQRGKLQFVGGNVSDDSSNDKTVVTVARELTQAEYDALSSAEKNNGTTYYITDAPSSYTGVPQSMIGDAWVTSHAYAVGDYCIDGNVLYKCKTAHTSSASYRPPYASYWDAVTVAGEVKDKRIYLYKNGQKYNFAYGKYTEYASFTETTKTIDIVSSSYVGQGASIVLCTSGSVNIPSNANDLIIEMSFSTIPDNFYITWSLVQNYSISYNTSVGTTYSSGGFHNLMGGTVRAGAGSVSLKIPLDKVSVNNAYVRMYAYGTTAGELSMAIRRIYFE